MCESRLGDCRIWIGTVPSTVMNFTLSDRARFGLLPLIARLLLVSEFLVALNGKIFGWSGQASYMASKGMHFIPP
ncbi:MAG: hypothetical protein ACREK8_08700, partial [Gemmatimonadales bacterium]